MRLTVLGSGDAFGSGGRLQTSFHVAPDGRDDAFLIDCGVTSVMGLERAGLDPDRITTIFVTHLHGDHFGGLVWWLLHAQHIKRRTRPLTVAGPPGIEARFRTATEALFPGALASARRFVMNFIELAAGTEQIVDGVAVEPFTVSHPSGAPSYALRFRCGSGAASRTIAFSGDTEWLDTLRDVARDADLYITECYGYSTRTRYHMSWREIERELPSLQARRILVTHMGNEMLAHRSEIAHALVTVAEDGLVIEL